ncbi:hypothetical protein OG948_59230 (plasmid) [Embleya sp. NBC_00888]|uniref:hypothetical protein n=1 Tax=Embleya sp. NBC_00888 TaxID=2975960 RepID=UPI002F919E6C|nr:hypothetical protein OG948_59230 [Embleya sp. NBC_00888]
MYEERRSDPVCYLRDVLTIREKFLAPLVVRAVIASRECGAIWEQIACAHDPEHVALEAQGLRVEVPAVKGGPRSARSTRSAGSATACRRTGVAR